MTDTDTDTDTDSSGDGDGDGDSGRDESNEVADTATLTAVVDRFEGDLAVLILEAGGETVGEKLVSTDDLPADAQKQDAILEVTIELGDLASIEYDSEKTKRRGDAAQSRFDRLSRRPPNSGDDSGGDDD